MFLVKIPEPFQFNPWKHHAGFLGEVIESSRKGVLDSTVFQKGLQKMGSSMIDLYIGKLSVSEVINQIYQNLSDIHCLKRSAYELYIGKTLKKYQKTTLKDGSEWILLIGRGERQYLHIHPKRGSKYSIRIGALALKTALVIKAYFENQVQSTNLVDLVNEVRIFHLNESPVKNTANTKRVRLVLDCL